MSKQRLFSGIQPTGNLHLGNYLGAVANWVRLQGESEAIFCVVDLHAITIAQNPTQLRQNILDVVRVYLAAGIDPQKSIIFAQSDVSAHSELCWILNTIAQNGDLTKMTQFKSKSGFDMDKNLEDTKREMSGLEGKLIKSLSSELRERKIIDAERIAAGVGAVMIQSSIETAEIFVRDFKKHFNSVSVGLFDYPVLMAADILLYDTVVVPVGEDQVQHVELARTLARRFNSQFGETFVVPQVQLQKEGARIMGLDNPVKKMSKSAPSIYNYISLTDDAELVRKKIRKAVTDSGSEIVYSDDKPALKNLINIYHLLSGKQIAQIQADYAGKGYGDFKNDLAQVVVDFITPLQEKIAQISDNEVRKILADGAVRANKIAQIKIAQIKAKMGLGV